MVDRNWTESKQPYKLRRHHVANICCKLLLNYSQILNWIQTFWHAQAAPCGWGQLHSLPLSRQPQLQNCQVGTIQMATSLIEIFCNSQQLAYIPVDLKQFDVNILSTFLIFRERWWFVAMSNCQSTRGLKFRLDKIRQDMFGCINGPRQPSFMYKQIESLTFLLNIELFIPPFRYLIRIISQS